MQILVFVCTILFAVVSIDALASSKESRPQQPDNYQIATKGASKWRIVVSDKASLSEKYAAKELQTFFEQISGVRLPVVDDKGQVRKQEFVIGDNTHLRKLPVKINYKKLGTDGYQLCTVNGSIVITGGRERGTMYGVYAFLENYLGCRWYSSTVSKIPRKTVVSLEPFNVIQIPVFAYRDVMYFDAFDGDWAARNRVYGINARLRPEQGGSYPWATPQWHTFLWLLPEGVYFKDHPEYYSYIAERNMRMPLNLCLTNEDMIKVVTERVKKWMREQPDKRYFSVSQPDWNYRCSCDKCTAMNEQEGGAQGTNIYFANRIAAAIKDEFPNNRIVTFAYATTFYPPKTMKPADNVVIHFAPLEGDAQKSIEGWSKLTKNIIVWDYLIGYTHFIIPFPNLYYMQSGIQTYADKHVMGEMTQAQYQDNGGEFAELRAYILARLLWNPKADVKAIIDDFVSGYYGKAAKHIREYIEILNKNSLPAKITPEKQQLIDKWADKFKGWWTFGYTGLYMNDQQITRYEVLFQKAEKLASDAPALLLRVRVAHLPVQTIQIHLLAKDDPRRAEVISRYFDTIAVYNAANADTGRKIWRYGEWKSMDEFKASLSQ